MPELQVGLADVSVLSFDQFYLQFNAQKNINGKKSSRFELNAED